jgi:hypothetical protein
MIAFGGYQAPRQADERSCGFLSEGLEVFPEVRPGLAEVSADKEVGIAVDRASRDAVSLGKMADQLAGRKAVIQEVTMHSDHDHGLGRRVAVSTWPVA